MSGFSMSSFEEDPAQIVRTIGRISQMLIEMRDEYIDQHRDDTLDQIERRIQELGELSAQLRTSRERETEAG